MESENGPGARRRQSDDRKDRWALGLASFAVLGLFFFIGGFYNAMIAYVVAPETTSTALARAGSNGVVSIAFCALVAVSGAHRRSTTWRTTILVMTAAVLAALVRNELFVLVDVIPPAHDMRYVVELGAGVLFFATATALGRQYMVSQHQLRAKERQRAHENLQRELALRALETEEIKVRRSIAEGLHGSLQQRLVILTVRLDLFIDEARRRGEDAATLAPLLEMRADLDSTREVDVRAMSRMLYPEGIEIGVVAAVRLLLRRLPAGIATSLAVGDELRALDDPGASLIHEADRLLVVRLVEEGVTNALRHGQSTRFTLRLDVVDKTIVLDVSSNGATVDAARLAEGSAFARLRERLDLVGGSITLEDDLHRPGADLGRGEEELHVHLRGVVPLDLDDGARTPASRARAILEGWVVRGYLGPASLPPVEAGTAESAPEGAAGPDGAGRGAEREDVAT